MKVHLYYVYMLTNKNKTVLYTGVTNNLRVRLQQHVSSTIPGFTSRYNCHYLVYYETHDHIQNAIAREKEIKKWRREKKDNLISSSNPDWRFLNDDILA